MQFWGYERPDGTVGVRNFLAVFGAGSTGHHMAVGIAKEVKGAVPLLMDEALLRLKEDRDRARRAAVGLLRNPNLGAIVIIGLGGGPMDPDGLAKEIADSGKPVEVATVLGCKGYSHAMNKGLKAARELMGEISRAKRQPVSMGHLTLGVKCGGSAGNSGLLGNVVVGRVVDSLIASGGSTIFSETPEVIGAEHLLAKRALDDRVARRVLEVVGRMEKKIRSAGEDIRGSQPTGGNIKNGLTTLEEKSLGALAKTGTGPLAGVLEYAERPAGRGLFFMDGPAGPVSIMVGEAAAGAQIFVYSLGGGIYSSFRNLPGWGIGGMPLGPTISVVSNTSVPGDDQEEEFFDIHCQGVIDDRESIGQVADRFLDELLAVASGKPSKAELSLPQYWVPLESYHTGPML
jgi:altronate dehydratase large subunit